MRTSIFNIYLNNLDLFRAKNLYELIKKLYIYIIFQSLLTIMTTFKETPL